MHTEIITNRQMNRNSSVELLKVFAIIMIVFSHTIPITVNPNIPSSSYLMDINLATSSIQRFIIILCKWGGQFGNAIFLICSSWFLSCGDTRNYYKKICRIVGDTLTINLILLILFSLLRYPLSYNDILNAIFPVWRSSNWFVTCFIVYLLFVPLLNAAIDNTPMNIHASICICLIWMYIIVNFFFNGSFYYSHVIGFLCIFIIVSFVKKYQLIKIFTMKLFYVSVLGNLGLAIVTNLLGLRISVFSDFMLRWCKFYNPFHLITAICLLKYALEHETVSKRINYVSSLSLLIYLIHNNMLIMNYSIGEIWNWIYNNLSYQFELLWVIVVAICLFLLSLIASIIYRCTVQRLVYCLTDSFFQKVKKTAYALLMRLRITLCMELGKL